MGGKYNFLFLIISFLTGIVVTHAYEIGISYRLIIVQVILLLIFLPFSQLFLFKIVNSLNIYLLFFCLGGYAYNTDNKNLPKDVPLNFKEIKSYYVMSLDTKKLKKKWNKMEMLLVAYMNNKNEIIKPSQRVFIQVFLYENEEVKSIKYGDTFKIDNKFHKIDDLSLTPQYKSWLENKKVLYYDFVYPKMISFLYNHPDSILKQKLSILNNDFCERLVKFIKNKSHIGFLEAMILGRKDNLDAETKRIYTKAGLCHLIAISGLHIGFLFLFLNFLFSLLLNYNSFTRFTKKIILIVLLWLYTFLIGFPPSALRATTMATFLLLFQSQHNRMSLLMQTVLSLFFLSILSPQILFSIGAQLSYAAVMGIALLFIPLHGKIKNIPTPFRQVLSGILLYISVQTFTAPISIFYFRQFPTYSMICNITMTPLASPIFILGLLTIFASYINENLHNLISIILSLFMNIINKTSSFIGEMPNSIIYL